MRTMGLGTHLPVYTEIQPGGPSYETVWVFQRPFEDKGQPELHIKDRAVNTLRLGYKNQSVNAV